MRQATFTVLAEADLDDIAAYTYRTWGKPQAVRYIKALRAHCGMLAKNPGLGRPCPQILPGLRRSETGSHVVLFRESPSGITVSRILHQRTLVELHPIDEADPDL